MNQLRLFLLALAIGLVLVSCQPGAEGTATPAAEETATPATATPAEFNLGEPFTLAGGQAAVNSSAGLRLRFEEVLEDSRCPTEVECVWTGQARIALLVQQGEGEPIRVAFNTNPAPGQNQQTAEVGEYTIELQSLDPYPETTAAIPFQDYRATLIVSKAD